MSPVRRTTLGWSLLLVLLLVALSWLVGMSVQDEHHRAQVDTDATAQDLANELRQRLAAHQAWLNERANAREVPLPGETDTSSWGSERPDVLALALREGPGRPPMLRPNPVTPARAPVDALHLAAMDEACDHASARGMVAFGASHFLPFGDGTGVEVMVICAIGKDALGAGREMVMWISLPELLNQATRAEQRSRYDVSFIEPDGTRIARNPSARGAGVYLADRLISLGGQVLLLHVNSVRQRPTWMPTFTVGLSVVLSAGLLALAVVLARDMRQRSRAEAALSEALAFRRSIERSVVIGLVATDLARRVTYVNQALCRMIGATSERLQDTPMADFRPAIATASASGTATHDETEGHEESLQATDGRTVPVRVLERALHDAAGRHTGWICTVVDLTRQRQAETQSREQHDKLQGVARLALLGEMASLLSHELNQPLSAVSSFSAGALNLLQQPVADSHERALVTHAMQRISDQAERAGRIIKSIHALARRRESLRVLLRIDELVLAVMPLVALQARGANVQIRQSWPDPMPRVRADRTMLEQVVLNLARNAIQSMQQQEATLPRVLQIGCSPERDGEVCLFVEDSGAGMAPATIERLGTPFFTTRPEGLGLGLSLCRTVIEQHRGRLAWRALAPDEAAPTRRGMRFECTIPCALRDTDRTHESPP